MFCEYFKRLPVVVINIEQKITLVLWKPRKCHILLHFFVFLVITITEILSRVKIHHG